MVYFLYEVGKPSYDRCVPLCLETPPHAALPDPLAVLCIVMLLSSMPADSQNGCHTRGAPVPSMMRRHAYRTTCSYFAKASLHSGSASMWALKASSTLSMNAKELGGGMMSISLPCSRPRYEHPSKSFFLWVHPWLGDRVNRGIFRCTRPALDIYVHKYNIFVPGIYKV